MHLYKVLNTDGTPHNGGVGQWSLPTQREDGAWQPGDWMPPIEGRLRPCANGYHVCRIDQLLKWIGPAIYLVEVRGDVIVEDDKIIAREARLVRPMHWDECAARLFACACAERVLSIFERICPGDGRPHKAIQASRQYALGEISMAELDAARTAAWDAACAAAWVAVRDAAWDAACDAEQRWQYRQLWCYLWGYLP